MALSKIIMRASVNSEFAYYTCAVQTPGAKNTESMGAKSCVLNPEVKGVKSCALNPTQKGAKPGL